jgi:hypothetical protein
MGTMSGAARIAGVRPNRQHPELDAALAACERVLICDPQLSHEFIVQRQAIGLDRYDEVWDGVYVMSPSANDEHQEIVGGFTTVLTIVIDWAGLGKVRPGVNVSDRIEGWTQNYRIPEALVFLNANPARNLQTHWVGGPDFGVEVLSEGERAREKFDFYAKVSMREILVVDRFPWALELYILKRQKLRLVGRSTLEKPKVLKSKVLPLSFRLVAGESRPLIEVRHAETGQTWPV